MEHAGATAQRHPDLLSLAQVAVAPRGHRHWELRSRIPAAHKPARSVFGGARSGGSRQMVMAGSLCNAPALYRRNHHLDAELAADAEFFSEKPSLGNLASLESQNAHFRK